MANYRHKIGMYIDMIVWVIITNVLIIEKTEVIMVRIGIPRAMSYYYLYPFFKTLLSKMGASVVLSKPTTKATLHRMNVCPTDEPCVAVKLYFAHAHELVETECEYLFLPKIVSVEKGVFCCPKFIGVPDMVRNSIKESAKILSPRIDFTNWKNTVHDIRQLAEKLGAPKNRANEFINHAWKVQEEVNAFTAKQQLTTEDAYRIFNAGMDWKETVARIQPDSHLYKNGPRIGVIGHPYVLYEWISHGLISQFRKFGKVITPEMVDHKSIKSKIKGIYEGDKLWSFEAQMLGAALHLIESRLIDRIVLVGLFECGPESIIETYIEEAAEMYSIPLLKLFMDDQTGEAGLITRIEAFMDTAAENIESNRKRTTNVPLPEVTHKAKPVVGFPSMGHLDIVVRSILEECGVEMVNTPPVSRASIELGKELAPEFVCLPLTATLGQMIQMMEKGANRFLMVGGKGKCRLGWYAQVQELLLRRKGYLFDMVILDTPFPLRKNGLNFIKDLIKITNGARWDKVARSLMFGYNKLKALDEADAICRRMRAYEINRGEADRCLSVFKSQVANAGDYRTMAKIRRDFMNRILSIKTEDTDPLIVSMVGEIWVLLEPYVNMDVEKFLGSREHVRVWVQREHSISHWFEGNVLHTRMAKTRINEIRNAAFPYLSEPVGGHGQDSVGLAVLASNEGIDGVVHIMPFTCMPEIVAHNILTQVSDRIDVPVLSLIISDQTGEAGIETRLEAFLDLLLERKFQKKIKVVK